MQVTKRETRGTNFNCKRLGSEGSLRGLSRVLARCSEAEIAIDQAPLEPLADVYWVIMAAGQSRTETNLEKLSELTAELADVQKHSD